jgi:3-carboxy-cis,cis-muconate cycloisomerase
VSGGGSSFGRGGLFGGLFDRGAAGTGDEAWLAAMLDTEAALARALERAGLAPAGAGAAVTEAARPGSVNADELARAAAQTGNPVPGLVRALTAAVPAEAAGAVHQGATSQDIIDTAVMLMARRVLDGILADLSAAAAAAATLAGAHRETIMIGRTLLQQAVPVTFGLVAAGWLTAIDEARQGLHRIRGQRLAVQFGGAAGTLASLGDHGPRVRALLADELGLASPVLPWHTDRLRIVELAAALAGACGVLGKIARDVTLLAQSEVAEVREGPSGAVGPSSAGADVAAGGASSGGAGAAAGGASAGGRRGGSSAMPHKRNPVAAVVILGCTRQAPGLLATITACAEQEHQRAAGAWHAEWEPVADLLRLTGSAASWAAELLAGLEVDADRMHANLDGAGGLPLAESVTAALAPVLGRLPAHDLVADASATAAATGRELREALLNSPSLAARLEEAGMIPDQIDAALDPTRYLGSAAVFTDQALAAHRARENSQLHDRG